MIAAAAISFTACGEADAKKTAVETVGSKSEAAQNAVVIGLCDDFAPYMTENDGKVSGIDVEAAQAVADTMGNTFAYLSADRQKIAEDLKNGVYDVALCGFTANDAEEIKSLTDQKLTLSDSCYGYIQGVLVDSSSHLSELTEANISDNDLNIGVKKNSAAEALLKDVVPEEKLHTYETGIDAVNAVVGREIDCVVTDINPAYEYEKLYDSIKLLSQPYTHGAFYFISADNAEITALNEAIKTLPDGTVHSIEEKYIQDDIGFWTPVKIWFSKFIYDFRLNFIEKDRWMFLVTGLGNTLLLTLMAALLGMVIGIIIAAIRTTYDNNLESLQHNKGFGYYILKFANAISKLYLTVIRGTPVFVQLLIIFFVIFASSKNKMMVAVLAFGINSGAYVAEILRGGIMAIDKGQFEAGRSIGFNYVQTMLYIIIPQVLKNVLPTLLNEFIALLKETSVACYVGVLDLTRAGNIIRGTTFTDLLPLLAVALIYLVVVLILTKLVSILERRLRKSER